MKRWLLVILSLLLLGAGAQAQDVTSSGFGLDPSDAQAVKAIRKRMDKIRRHRPVVALVLSGGGAKGAATVGALKFMEQYDLPIDMVVGTSIGGLLGGMYAMGYDVAYLDSLIRNMDWDMALSDKVSSDYIPYSRQQYKERFALSIPFYYRPDDDRRPDSGDGVFRSRSGEPLDLSAAVTGFAELLSGNVVGSLPSGLVYGQNVNHIISSRTVGYSDSLSFFDLPIPFACVATDLASCKAKVWHSGSLNLAMRSTMSIPGLFTPVRTQGMVLADGGMRNNFPVDLARQMGADIIIGIDLSTSSKNASEIRNLADILMQGVDMLASDAFQRNVEKVSVYIHPDLEGYNMLSFNAEAVDSMLVRGYKGAEVMAPQLDSVRRLVGRKAHRTLQAPPAVDIGRRPVLIDSVEVVGVSPRDAEYIRSKMLIEAGSLVDFRSLENDIATVFGEGSFDFVNYELRGREEPYRLRLICKRGPMHQFGVGFRVDSEDLVAVLLNLGLNVNAMQGHSLDMTARVGANPYMDVHYAYRAPRIPVLNGRVRVRWTDRNNFISGTNFFNISFLLTSAEAYISNFRWSNLDMKLGIKNDYYRIRKILSTDVIGDYDPGSSSRDYPGAFVLGRMETLDNGYFPTKGASAGIRYDLVSRVFDPDQPHFFGVLAMDGLMPVTWNRFTLLPQGSLRFLFGDEIPLVYANALGGDIRGRYVDQQIPFVGIDNAAFRRNNLLVGRLDARYRFGKSHYVSLMGNVSYDFYTFQQFEYGEWLYGLGAGYAYQTAVGPLKLQLYWSSLSKRVGAYFSLGFNF